MLNTNKLNNFLKKNKNKKIVLCHGVFDLLHIGHINYLKKAKSFGDILIVSITSRRFVNKGDGRPIFSDNERKKFLENISFVDYVYINKDLTAVSLIKKIKPDFYCKGKEYSNYKNDLTNNILKEIKVTKKSGGNFKIIKTRAYSSSSIINKNLENYNKKQQKFLESVRNKLTNNKISNIKKNLKKLSVTIIGEAIIDEYVFSETIGKSGKDPMLVTKNINEKKYLGGVLSVANIIASFTKNVNVITYLGSYENHISFIKKKIKRNVRINFIKKNSSPTIYKKRYVDHYFQNKIFGSYKINNNFLNPAEETKLINFINNIKKNELVCVMDYGHGIFTDKICKKINTIKNVKTLNVQLNSSNLTYQKISKFKNFDFACFNEKEVFFENKIFQSDIDIAKLTEITAKKQNFKKMVTSLGMKGSLMFNKSNNKIINCPGFSKTAKDRIGAGDSLFAMSSILNSFKVDDEIKLLMANYIALLSLNENGPIQNINSDNFFKHFEHFIK